MSQNYDYIEQFNNELPLNLYKKDDIESKAIGNYLNKIQSMTDILESDINPITCKYKGLVAWENFFKLPSNNLENIDFRRAKVLSELIQYMSDENVIRKYEMETILGFYGITPNIIEYPSEYFFIVNYTSTLNLNLNNLNSIIKSIKPSYLNYTIANIESKNIIIQEEYTKLKVKYKLSNKVKTESRKVHSIVENININERYRLFPVKYKISGKTKTKSVEVNISNENIKLVETQLSTRVKYNICGKAICGR